MSRLRKLFTLPVWLGGLGVFGPSLVALLQHSYFLKVNAGLVGLIISQLGDCIDEQFCKFHSKSHQEQANHLFDELPPSMRSSVS